MAPEATNHERIYRGIKADYLDGRFVVGQRIDMTMIADRHRVSLTPVRDAMHRLAGEELMEAHMDGGFRILIPDRERLFHLYAWNAHHIQSAVNASTEDALVRNMAEFAANPLPPSDLLRVHHVAAFFHALVTATGNLEYAAAVERSNERLAYVRLAEMSYFRRPDRELAQLVNPVTNNVHLNLRRRLWSYHRRRIEHVTAISNRVTADSTDGNGAVF
ncbi:transcriptional regulator, GntR family [Sphingobium sp. YR657]|jgi:DNA-binding GntR family transcriptional regulator|uniref:GntR family transcriptional regulator n=1 Tax=Sphingobium sp. YR657 TaxID=1884366 RepID=UPI0009196D48|nr:GntR family transcriptional regulator [Sphingobium sp. YR657]SHM66115.1 transcriptional regulator, GntR family [Sphingobium sp. YR657]